MRRMRAISVTGLACLVVGSADLAFAEEQSAEVAQADEQTPAQAASPDETEARPRRKVKSGVEEIVVRARRREETLQETPLTVTAFSSTDLIDKNIVDIQDIGQFVPNLQFDQSLGAQNDARIYLRGIGNGDSIITDEAGVGVVIDDVFLPRAAGVLQALSDTQSVEVLAGPQATLYGKNTVGGLVRVTTNKPGWQQEGRATVRVGSNDLLRTRMVWNQPLIDERLSMRINLGTRYDEGALDNRGLGRDRTGQTRSLDGTLQLLYQPSEDLEFIVKARRSKDNNSGLAAKCKLLTGISAENSIDGQLFGPNGRFGSFNEECSKDQQRDFDEVSFDGKTESDLDTYGTSFHMTWSPSPLVTIKSVTAWNRNKSSAFSDTDLTSLPLSNELAFNRNDSIQDAISQEINFAGELMDGRLNWIGGAYFLKEKNQDNGRDTQNSATFGNPQTLLFGGFLADNFGSGPVPQALLDAVEVPELPGQPLIRITNGASSECIQSFNPVTVTTIMVSGLTIPVRTTPCLRAFEGIRTISTRKSDVISYAAYGQLDFRINDQWSVAVGTRYTHERKSVDRLVEVFSDDIDRIQEVRTAARGNRLNDFQGSDRFGRFSPSASISFRPTDDWNFYATWSRGFKSGGFNGRGVGDEGERLVYDEEVVTNYEVGLKAQLFDRASITMAYFHTNYEDIQLLQTRLDSNRRILVETDNLGTAAINGFEFAVQTTPISNLFLNANVGITSGRYEKIDQKGTVLVPLDPNNRLTGTPTYTGSVSASYLVPVGRLGDLRMNLNWSHQGSKANDTGNATFSGKRGLLGASFALELPDGKTRITLGGTNVLDREYLSNSLNVVRNVFEYFGRGRELYLEVAREF